MRVKPCSHAEILLWLGLGGGDHSPQKPNLHRLPPKTQVEGGFRGNLWSEAANTRPPLHKLAQLWNPQPHRAHPQAIQVRGR